MVLFQARDLNEPHHGHFKEIERLKGKYANDYKLFEEGRFTPTIRQRQNLINQGYEMPDLDDMVIAAKRQKKK